MIRLMSTAFLLCLMSDLAQAEIGCAVPCGAPCQESCCEGKPRRKFGCGLMAHGSWLKRSACCNECGDCGGSSDYGHGCRSGRCGRGGCHGKGRGWLGHRHCIEGQDWHFNCGCNGSYNYPVPPLYTYHWPGMYKAQRMTDYQSPWRFPPLRPYTEETLAPLIEEVPEAGDPSLAPIVHVRSIPTELQSELPGTSDEEIESVSSRLRRMNSR